MHQILHSMVYLINMRSFTSIKLYKINLLVSKSTLHLLMTIISMFEFYLLSLQNWKKFKEKK